MMNPPPPRPMYLEEFAPLVGQTLLADCDPQAVPLLLVEAKPLTNHAKLERPPFILILRSAPDTLLVSGSYVLKGPDFGPDQINLIQIIRPQASEPGQYYQAVFN